jgi:hypothetical protein
MIRVLSNVATVSLGQCFPRLLRNVVHPCSWVVEAQEKFYSLTLDLLVVGIISFFLYLWSFVFVCVYIYCLLVLFFKLNCRIELN